MWKHDTIYTANGVDNLTHPNELLTQVEDDITLRMEHILEDNSVPGMPETGLP